MRLVLFDLPSERRGNFNPICLSRPIWELRCGMSSLGEKIIARLGATDVAQFVPQYMAAAYAEQTGYPVNDAKTLGGDDLLLVNPRVKAEALNVETTGAPEVCLSDEGEVLYARVPADTLAKLQAGSIEELLESVKSLPNVQRDLATWNYTWDLVLANPDQITEDFRAAGMSGIVGSVEEPRAIRGSEKDVYVASGAKVHPMVVLDAEHGPIYIDQDVEVHPFTRIEGPCYVGKKSILLGAKCREGNSIGPVCRVGGEVEESIIHGHSNKYHDGFLGHAYVGEWVNLGALTTNSDLKNDYSDVSVVLDGKKPVGTGSTKVGSLIGDHTKTSIGALFNTGAYVGAMTLIMATGSPLPKFIPSFTWFLNGVPTKGFGKKKLYQTARTAMSRRKKEWTDAQEAMWDAIFELTAPVRNPVIKKGRREMTRGR